MTAYVSLTGTSSNVADCPSLPTGTQAPGLFMGDLLDGITEYPTIGMPMRPTMVQVVVGVAPSQKSFSLPSSHVSTIPGHQTLEQSPDQFQYLRVNLVHESPRAFELWVTWLYQGLQDDDSDLINQYPDPCDWMLLLRMLTRWDSARSLRMGAVKWVLNMIIRRFVFTDWTDGQASKTTMRQLLECYVIALEHDFRYIAVHFAVIASDFIQIRCTLSWNWMVQLLLD